MTLKALALLATLALSGIARGQSAMETGAAILSERAADYAKRGWLSTAERDLNVAIEARPRQKYYYKQRGMIRYSRKNYSGALQDFDAYLEAAPQDAAVVLVRDLAERSAIAEDIPHSCAALFPIRANLENMGLEKYCTGQVGW